MYILYNKFFFSIFFGIVCVAFLFAISYSVAVLRLFSTTRASSRFACTAARASGWDK